MMTHPVVMVLIFSLSAPFRSFVSAVLPSDVLLFYAPLLLTSAPHLLFSSSHTRGSGSIEFECRLLYPVFEMFSLLSPPLFRLSSCVMQRDADGGV